MEQKLIDLKVLSGNSHSCVYIIDIRIDQLFPDAKILADLY